MNTFALWDTIDQKILSYPRADDQPVVISTRVIW